MADPGGDTLGEPLGQTVGDPGRRELHRAVDTAKDQSYVLGVLDEQQLARAFFPLGDSTKAQVRQEAAERGFAVAKKPDSHDICFIADGDTQGFLGRYLDDDPGPIVEYLGQLAPEAARQARADLEGRRVNVLIGLMELARGEALMDREKTLLTRALRLLDQHDHVPVIGDMRELLTSRPADLAAVALENALLVNVLAQANRGLKQAQQDIEQANVRLREMDELKSSFLSVITHEMRTPLANMAFSMQIMQMYGDTNFLPEQREQLDQIGANLATARRMIDNLVTFASFLNKQVRLSLEPVDFKLLVLEALVPLKPAADDKKLDLQISSVGDMPAVHADVSLVKDAIQHLVHNAIKYTNEGGSVWVSSWATTDAVCFDVKDNGVGAVSYTHLTLPTIYPV